MRPAREPEAWCCLCPTAAAATSIAGLSRKLPASSWEASTDRTSRSSSPSPRQAWRKNPSRSARGRSSTACRMLSIRFQRSGSIGRFALHFAIKPRPCGTPVPHHGYWRDLEHLRRFFHAQSSEKSKFHDSRLAGVKTGERLQCLVEHNQVLIPLAHCGSIVERNVLHRCSPLEITAPGMIYQNPSHELRRNSKEGAVSPAHALVFGESDIGFVHQGGRLQTVPGALCAHVVPPPGVAVRR